MGGCLNSQHGAATDLVAAVTDLDPLGHAACIVPEGHYECVHAMVIYGPAAVGAGDLQPREHRGHAAVLCRIAYPPASMQLWFSEVMRATPGRSWRCL